MNRDDRYDTGTMQSIDTANLMPLSRMSDFKVADNDQDVRGWKVIARDGDTIGKVDDLLIDTTARRVRYLGVDLDRGLLSGRSHSGKVLIPIESVRLDRHDRVLLDSVGSSEIMTLPTYDASSFGTGQSMGNRMDTDRLDTEREQRLTLSEEELAVGKRRVASGEVEVGKRPRGLSLDAALRSCVKRSRSSAGRLRARAPRRPSRMARSTCRSLTKR